MNRLKGELGRFLIVGLTTVGIDFITYTLLLHLGMATGFAKAAGFLTGAIFAYFANRSWTFNTTGSAQRFAAFIAVYLINLGINVGVNHAMLVLLAGASGAVLAAFFVATGISATLNFVGMKLVVFNSKLFPEKRAS